MKLRDPRAHVWIIWGLVGSFGLVEAVAWTVGGGIPRRPMVLVQVITAWIVMLILASLATHDNITVDYHEDAAGRIDQILV